MIDGHLCKGTDTIYAADSGMNLRENMIFYYLIFQPIFSLINVFRHTSSCYAIWMSFKWLKRGWLLLIWVTNDIMYAKVPWNHPYFYHEMSGKWPKIGNKSIDGAHFLTFLTLAPLEVLTFKAEYLPF